MLAQDDSKVIQQQKTTPGTQSLPKKVASECKHHLYENSVVNRKGYYDPEKTCGSIFFTVTWRHTSHQEKLCKTLTDSKRKRVTAV